MTDETDAQPTDGPWTTGVAGNPESHPTLTIKQANKDAGGYIGNTRSARAKAENLANARLIAAAGTAAHEAKQMGYDPVAAVEALPDALDVLQKLLPLARVQSSIDHTVIEDVLASAEGGDQ